MRREIQVDGSVVNGIATEYKECFNPACLEVVSQLTERLHLAARIRLGWFSVENCLADVSKSLIQPMNERVNQWRLPFAGDDDRRTTTRFEIIHDRTEPRVCSFDWPRRRRRSQKFVRQSKRQCRHVTAAIREAVIGH